jgi:phage tail sheath protein FI
MPQYLAPGVYVEEVSFRSKSIEGVSTTVTGFIGPTRFGPVDLDNELLTSLGDFERAYGDRNQLEFEATLLHNYVWHAARAFFQEGGKQLYVSRIFRRLDSAGNTEAIGGQVDASPSKQGQLYNDGHSRGRLSDPSTHVDHSLNVRARWPGWEGDLRVRLIVARGQNVLAFDRRNVNGVDVDVARLPSLVDRDVVLIQRGTSPVTTDFYLATFNTDDHTFTFVPKSGPTLDTTGAGANALQRGDKVQIVKLNVGVAPADGLGAFEVWEGLAPDQNHQTNGAFDGLTYVFGSHVETPHLERAHGRDKPVVILEESHVTDGLDVLQALFDAAPAQVSSPPAPGDHASLRDDVLDDTLGDGDRWVDVVLSGGNDGLLPGATEYEGEADPHSTSKYGLKQFEDLDILSIVAAPGATFNYRNDPDRANTIINLLIGHCERMRYRIAVLDSGNNLSLNEVQDMRARFDSSYAAFYYPWVRVLDPVTRVPIYLPPSGFVSGIYARNDITRAVFKAPANEVVTLSIGFEVLLNKAQQDVLNPAGINCFRFFEGRGYRLWGGRTISSDPEWKYVNLRRYFAYLEHSIDRGTQWAVFEPNGPQLWANIRQTIADFLLNEFFSGALLGDKPEQSYFVRCDRSTMTQNDLDNGRLVCLVGVSPIKPAEFVIFRIGQWTADRK